MGTRYRNPSKQPRTAWAVHIDRYMREHGMSQQGAFEAARQALGLGPKSRAAFLPFLEGREPDTREAEALASVFGWPDPESDQPAEAEPGLAAALTMLAQELAALRVERRELVGRVTDLEMAVAALAERSLRDAGPGAAPEHGYPASHQAGGR